MEGKEVRFGIANSALWATVTTDTSCGAINSWHDSFTAIGGFIDPTHLARSPKVAACCDEDIVRILRVDDDSPDGTAEMVRALGRTQANIRCLQRLGRRGLSSACIDGILASSAPYAAVMDGDLQHDENLLPTLPVFLTLLDVAVDPSASPAEAEWQAIDPPERRRRTLDQKLSEGIRNREEGSYGRDTESAPAYSGARMRRRTARIAAPSREMVSEDPSSTPRRPKILSALGPMLCIRKCE